MILHYKYFLLSLIYPACDRGARVPTCAGFINQSQSFQFEPGMAMIES